MANLLVIWKPLQVSSWMPKYSRGLPPCGNHAKGKPLLTFITCKSLMSTCLQLPQSLYGFLSQLLNKRNQSDMLTHCKCELVHAIWKILLDSEFLDAYKNGIVLQCHGVLHWIFPCIFTYLANYPEKYSKVSSACVMSLKLLPDRVLLATIQDKGLCPCPLCLIPKFVMVENPPISFSPFTLADYSLFSHFSFNDFIATAFLDLAKDLDIQI